MSLGSTLNRVRSIAAVFYTATANKVAAMMKPKSQYQTGGFRKFKLRNVRAGHKHGKTDKQLHAMRYPARKFAHNLHPHHAAYWEKRGYDVTVQQ